MRVLLAPDKFKGSLSAGEVAEAMALGVLDEVPGAGVVVCPMADGGDGTVDAVLAATGAERRVAGVRGPLPGDEVEASWAILPANSFPPSSAVGGLDPAEPVALIEMAQASGFTLIPEERRNPMRAGTWGTGDLVAEALEAGCRQLVVGVGGSGTVDGGAGMAVALGYRLLDGDGNELPGDGACLARIRRIDPSGADRRIARSRFLVATDVDNPLLGRRGAAKVFGPQKGAGPSEVEALEEGLANLASIVARDLGAEVAGIEGSGAAGGLAAGLVGFCAAEVVSGVALVSEAVRLAEKIGDSDLVLTGEGSFDSQSAGGKTPWGVALMASRKGIPAVIVAGALAGESQAGMPPGVATYCMLPGPLTREEAMRDAALHVRKGTSRLLRILGLAGPGA